MLIILTESNQATQTLFKAVSFLIRNPRSLGYVGHASKAKQREDNATQVVRWTPLRVRSDTTSPDAFSLPPSSRGPISSPLLLPRTSAASSSFDPPAPGDPVSLCCRARSIPPPISIVPPFHSPFVSSLSCAGLLPRRLRSREEDPRWPGSARSRWSTHSVRLFGSPSYLILPSLARWLVLLGWVSTVCGRKMDSPVREFPRFVAYGTDLFSVPRFRSTLAS
jgi:hypothetical protein